MKYHEDVIKSGSVKVCISLVLSGTTTVKLRL